MIHLRTESRSLLIFVWTQFCVSTGGYITCMLQLLLLLPNNENQLLSFHNCSIWPLVHDEFTMVKSHNDPMSPNGSPAHRSILHDWQIALPMTDDDIVQDILPDYESMRYKNNMNESYNAMIVNDTDSNNVLLVITTDQLVSMQYLFLFVIFLFEYFFYQHCIDFNHYYRHLSSFLAVLLNVKSIWQSCSFIIGYEYFSTYSIQIC